jgi:hypothetical protein
MTREKGSQDLGGHSYRTRKETLSEPKNGQFVGEATGKMGREPGTIRRE